MQWRIEVQRVRKCELGVGLERKWCLSICERSCLVSDDVKIRVILSLISNAGSLFRLRACPFRLRAYPFR